MSVSLGQPPRRVAIACGGTGGHLFPGLAIAGELRAAGCEPILLVSEKEIDRQALQGKADLEAYTLPAVGLSAGGQWSFLRGFATAYRQASRLFRKAPPAALLSMGGFTGAPPMLAARRFGARGFLHESNSVPGKANRWTSWMVDCAFVGFPGSGRGLHARQVLVTGTPVRPGFAPATAAACRRELGLDPDRPLILVTGGSQGAHAVNQLVSGALRILAQARAEVQLLWLTGGADAREAQRACSASGIPAQVHAFFDRMELALGASTFAVSRAGASSLAELAAVQVPAVLIPYPTAADQHQLHNAKAYVESGAAMLFDQETGTPDQLAQLMADLLNKDARRLQAMRQALACWHRPDAATQIVTTMLECLQKGSRGTYASGGRPVKLASSPGALA